MFTGRAKHFFIVTNPLNVLASDKDLDSAKDIVQLYRKGQLNTVRPNGITEDELWKAKQLYDSAFHPQSMFHLHIPYSFCLTDCNHLMWSSRREAVCPRKNVISSPRKHGNHWLYDDIL